MIDRVLKIRVSMVTDMGDGEFGFIKCEEERGG